VSKHTPGPWVIRTAATYRSQIEAINGKGRADVVARITTPKGGAEASDANARLIAAAPDMLEALEAIAPMLPHGAVDNDPQWAGAINAVRNAIKKARGTP
jgi:hypothetical protein